jgi:uncharacterized protein (DUF885 family)
LAGNARKETRMTAFMPRFSAAIAASVLLLAALAPAARAAEPAAQSEDQRLAAFFDEVWKRNVKDSPLLQAQLGMKGPDYGKWNDFSDAEATRRNGLVRADLQRLRAEFDPAKLSEQSRISYRIFEFLQERSLRNFPWRFHNYAFSTMQNPITQLASFLQNVHRVDDVADAEAYVSRLAGVEKVSQQFIENLELAAARGVVPTSYSFDPVLRTRATSSRARPSTTATRTPRSSRTSAPRSASCRSRTPRKSGCWRPARPRSPARSAAASTPRSRASTACAASLPAPTACGRCRTARPSTATRSTSGPATPR